MIITERAKYALAVHVGRSTEQVSSHPTRADIVLLAAQLCCGGQTISRTCRALHVARVMARSGI